MELRAREETGKDAAKVLEPVAWDCTDVSRLTVWEGPAVPESGKDGAAVFEPIGCDTMRVFEPTDTGSTGLEELA